MAADIPAVSTPTGTWRDLPNTTTPVTAAELNERDQALNAMRTALNSGDVPDGFAAAFTNPTTGLGRALTSGSELAGAETLPRKDMFHAANIDLNNGRFVGAVYRPKRALTVGSLGVWCAGAAGATPTLVRAGVYSLDGAGVATLIGSSANLTTALATNGAKQVFPLSSSVQLAVGTEYVVGVVVMTTATAPKINGLPPHAALAETPILGLRADSVTDLPASITVAARHVAPALPYVHLIPA